MDCDPCAEAGGFGFVKSDDQYAATYLRGKLPDDKGRAITVFRGPPGAEALAATDDRAGEQVRLDDHSGLTAVYHDGMWVFGPGTEQRVVKRQVFHWDRTVGHSLTFRLPSGIWGIRGPKPLDKRDLVMIATSLSD